MVTPFFCLLFVCTFVRSLCARKNRVMNLKEVCGFKSFRENVSVEVTGGMNCVVGENGSGKTNTLDGNFLTPCMAP